MNVHTQAVHAERDDIGDAAVMAIQVYFEQ